MRPRKRTGSSWPAVALAWIWVAAGGPEPTPAAPRAADQPAIRVARAPEAEDPREALRLAEEALAHDPGDPDRLAAAHRAAAAAGDADLALEYATLVIQQLLRAGADAEKLAPWREIVREGDPLAAESKARFETYAAELVRSAGVLERHRMFAAAASLLAACSATPLADRARERLERLLDEPGAASSMREAGLELAPHPLTRAESEDLARQDAHHAPWEKAWEFKSGHYVVRTNVGYRLGNDLLEALESIHALYRELLPIAEEEEDGRCTIRVTRTREELDRLVPGLPPATRAVYRKETRSVTAFDPRSEGRPLAALWAALFHEAAHDFTTRFAGEPLPGWLAEGTACYFEGAELGARGAIARIGIAQERLHRLPDRLRAPNEGDPSLLERLVGIDRASALPVEDYAVAWGLVYFLRHYENARSERIYEPAYRDFLASYRREGGPPPGERFVEYFVTRPADPEIPDLEALERRFVAFALDQYERHYGPADAARRFVEQARQQRADGRLERAVETYAVALRRLPGDARVRFERAELLASIGRADPAFVEYRRVRTEARRAAHAAGELPGFGDLDAEGVVAEIDRRLNALVPDVPARVAQAERALREGVASLARRYAELDLPRRALRLLDRAELALGGDVVLREARARLARATKVEPGIWRRLDPSAGLEVGPRRFAAGPDSLRSIGAAPAYAIVLATEHVPARFRIEAVVRFPKGDPTALAGLVFGADDRTGLHLGGLFAAGPAFVGRVSDGPTTRLVPVGSVPAAREVRLGIRRGPGEVELFVGGNSLGRVTLSPGSPSGPLGVYAQGDGIEFHGLRVLY